MTELQKLIGWATVERAKVHRSHLYHKQWGNECAAFGYEERYRTFDLILENAELLLHGQQPISEPEPHLQQTAVTRSAPCSKDGCSNEAVTEAELQKLNRSQNSAKPFVSGSLPLADALSFAEWIDINAVRNGQSTWKYRGDNFRADYSTIELLKIYQGGKDHKR